MRGLVVIAGVGLLGIGCAPKGAAEAPPRRIDLSEFAAPRLAADASDPAASDPTVAGPAAVDPGAAGGTRRDAALLGGLDTEPPPGVALGAGSYPERRRSRPVAPGEPVLVDSLVGQLNGQPIFADEFLAPIEDRLLAEAERLPPGEWLVQASRIIGTELQQQVFNALFLAEAEANLTPEQRVGLFAWMEQMEESLVAGHGGSYEVTRQKISEEGETVQERLNSQRNIGLIQELFRKRITPRVIVSWRDVEREYERRYDEFNPPGTVTVGRVVISTADVARLDEVRTRLDAGLPFLEVAEAYGEAYWRILEIGPTGIDRSAFSAQVLLDQLALLETAGDTAGPFEVGSRTWWIGIVTESRPEPRSLYEPDLQRELYSQLRQQRMGEEQNRYALSLLEQGIEEEIEAMNQALIEIAFRRYGPR